MEETRTIFERMTSYAVFRFAETIRVLLFMTLSILIFDFYPVTAIYGWYVTPIGWKYALAVWGYALV